jgi:hypothetical protein
MYQIVKRLVKANYEIRNSRNSTTPEARAPCSYLPVLMGIA